MRPLPNWAIDLVHDGIRGTSITRHDVVKATRRVMLSAHRNDWTWPEIETLLTDTRRRGLAVQITTGKGGRTISPGKRHEFLRRHWESTRQAANRPSWERKDVLGFIEAAQEALDGSDLGDTDRAVMQAAIDLGTQHGTSRPTLPKRMLAERTGHSPTSVQRSLARLVAAGWLALVQPGDYRTRRASLYTLCPGLAATYTGATPPEDQTVPKDHVPKDQPGGSQMDELTLTISRDELLACIGEAALARLLAEHRPQIENSVPHLRVVGDAD